MTDNENEFEEEIERLRKVVRMHTGMITNLEDDIKLLRDLIDLMPKAKPKKPVVPFAEVFPDMETLIQIKAQRFHNEPNRNGRRGGARPHEHVIKVGFWTDCDIKKYPDGTVSPFYFPVHSPSDIRPKDTDSMLGRAIDAGFTLLGCREIKGFDRTKGTRVNENQAVGLLPGGILVMADTGFASLQIADPVTSAPSSDPKLPIEIWTWRR